MDLSENEYKDILAKMIEEEIGEEEFKNLTMDIAKAMGIRNASSLAVRHSHVPSIHPVHLFICDSFYSPYKRN